MHADHFEIHVTCSCLPHQLSDSHDLPSPVKNRAAWAEKGIALCSVFVVVSLLVRSSSVAAVSNKTK